MISQINIILSPLENFIKTYKQYIGYFFLLLAILSFGFFWIDNGIKESGEKALLILWIILWIPIFARVFGLKLFQVMLPLRQELGILMGTLAFVHGAMYIVPYPTVLGESFFWFDDTTFISYLAFGFFALVLSIPLTLTSNKWAMRIMGRYWKGLHRIVYVIVIFTVIHVVLIGWSREFEIGPVLLLILYFIFKVLEWNSFSFIKKDTKKLYPKGQKWLCVPCGYIYDPRVGDVADGILPGTEFLDIPESWRCPDCGVSKSDFVPIEDAIISHKEYDAKIVDKTYLNPVTLKLVIRITHKIHTIAGQFVVFVWSDSEGEFTRSYSISEHIGDTLTFIIKMKESGRGSYILRTIEPNTNIRIRGVFGRFIVQDTMNAKIFIATGTGLAPIYNMIRALPEGVNKSLYFSVAAGSDLFYIDELKAIKNLDLHIHTTQEEVSNYNYGRVNIDTIVATPDTEWYLCGSPRMVQEVTHKLKARGYENVYSEEFI